MKESKHEEKVSVVQDFEPKGAIEEIEAGSPRQVATLPPKNSFVVFHVIPGRINSPVPILNPYIVGRVCSSHYHPTGTNPRLNARVWFDGFANPFRMIVITIPKNAILEWHRFLPC